MNKINHPLLVFNEVGRAKVSTRDLPAENHVYGYKPPP